ncbi:hypothetical protein FHS18_003518 [Paenibacillus phyllosphaerae]|uniref:Copper amine oxidase-like N-terminal domain-containing protein n=1 Tax=Paenibacillus phyllosphaerae TaxID=274593 RepID=A0A7W5AZ45_9BACL|nr:DUF3500 domain-containing protein [Paenibacillus phyllosphaerae]MBB3111450.1 hypothetical protein [Paenibacillus phyllosphaerae]
MRKLPTLKGYKGFIAGVALTAVVTVPFTSLAATATKSVAATFANIKVTLDGTAVSLKDGSGNAVEPLTYNGSVYVPLRAVSDVLGYGVSFDNTTKTVKLTGSTSTTAAGGAEGTPPGAPPTGGAEGTPPGAPPTGSTDTSTRVTDVAASIANDTTASTAQSTTDAQTAKIVELANAFMATLTDEQKESLQYDLTAENAAVWSNLPAGNVSRNGLMFASLSEESLTALKALAAQALGDSGYDTFKQIILADEYLATDNNTQMWDADLYYVAFLGTPSTTSAWTLQISGHHYASNITYNGQQTSATPVFVGVEPQTFTYNNVAYEPLATRHDAMYAMIQSLSTTELATAKLAKSFDDVLVGPGQDGNFPASEGIAVSSLSDDQQELVKAAITAWVQDTSPDISSELLEAYLSDEALAATKIAWSGSTDSSVHGSYIRIDGPRVWIEFVCQTGVAYKDQIHFHTVWRDKLADYGGSFNG